MIFLLAAGIDKDDNLVNGEDCDEEAHAADGDDKHTNLKRQSGWSDNDKHTTNIFKAMAHLENTLRAKSPALK